MSRRLFRLDVAIALLATACGFASADTSTTVAPPSCLAPPAAELAAVSPLAIKVDPNPVAVGSRATLTVAADGLPEGAIVGAGAAWQCWNGSQWINTHQIVRGGYGTEHGAAIEDGPGDTTTIPAVGIPLPDSSPIMIPDVEPGTYRLADTATQPGGGEISGWVIVEVTAGG